MLHDRFRLRTGLPNIGQCGLQIFFFARLGGHGIRKLNQICLLQQENQFTILFGTDAWQFLQW